MPSPINACEGNCTCPSNAVPSIAERPTLVAELTARFRCAAASRHAVCLVGLERSRGDAPLLLQRLRNRALAQGYELWPHWSEDAFIVLIPLDPSREAPGLARELSRTLAQAFTGQETFLGAASAIGVAIHPDHQLDVEDLLMHAESALEQARWDRSGWAVFDPDHEDACMSQVSLVGYLAAALQALDQLVLFYQPKVEMERGRLVGVEALIRWHHPTLGFLAPGLFIPLAERSGLIGPLTRWVLNEALRRSQAWRAQGLDVPIAVNLPAQSLQDPDLPDLIADLLACWEVPAASLELELTESAMLVDAPLAMRIMTSLRSLGVRLSLDDVGTGYSTLAHVRQLPVDVLKVDRSFVTGNLEAREDQIIVRTMIDLAHELGLKAVVEGVESREAWDKLRNWGCDAVQGYFVSRPVPAADLRPSDWKERCRPDAGGAPRLDDADRRV